MQATLTEVGGNIDAFACFMAKNARGASEPKECLAKAEASGYVGVVPRYFYEDLLLGRQIGLFDRKDLSLIRQKFGEQGLGQSPDVRSDFHMFWAIKVACNYLFSDDLG